MLKKGDLGCKMFFNGSQGRVSSLGASAKRFRQANILNASVQDKNLSAIYKNMTNAITTGGRQISQHSQSRGDEDPD